MRILVLIALMVASCLIIGWEILRVGEGRRAGQDALMLMRRLRRRLKTLILIVALYAIAAWFEDVAAAAHFTAKIALLYFGLAITMLVWILILAARDLRETALQAVEINRRLREEAIKDLERELRRRQEEPPHPPAD
jgi:hypothetical protein